jgi:hypothetical protein
MKVTLDYSPPSPSWLVRWKDPLDSYSRYKYFHFKWFARRFAKQLAANVPTETFGE